MSRQAERARKAADGIRIGLGIVGFFRKWRANRKAKRAGKPKPYTVGELFDAAVLVGEDVADTVKDRKR